MPHSSFGLILTPVTPICAWCVVFDDAGRCLLRGRDSLRVKLPIHTSSTDRLSDLKNDAGVENDDDDERQMKLANILDHIRDRTLREERCALRTVVVTDGELPHGGVAQPE